jgi:hypothetical protein
MMGSIGITVALIGWTLFLAIEQLAKGKYHAVRCARARALRRVPRPAAAPPQCCSQRCGCDRPLVC